LQDEKIQITVQTPHCSFSICCGGWDITVNYLYHYADFPVLYQDIDRDAPLGGITIDPEYERSHLILLSGKVRCPLVTQLVSQFPGHPVHKNPDPGR